MTETSPQRWREIEALMDRVLDAPESKREALLEEAGRIDADLRAQVERLMTASREAGTRFDTPPLLVARDALARALEEAHDKLAAGDTIGTYRITALLGRGGMGSVYRAERADGAFEKVVAIKVVKRGMDTDEVIRRFHHERRILARLQHPNIAGLIDGGITDDGLPFFVMELAEGDTIDKWCDRRTLLLQERLRLFQRVCQAVQYAHGHLIVHRDIKPANIIVADGGVKLLDFGIARLLGSGAAAAQASLQTSDARLTPRYAAPEQIKGLTPTTSTDVYSLGVLLYELLCGRPPYRLDGRSMLDIERIICEVDPAPPSMAVMRTARGDLTPAELAHRRGIGRPRTLRHRLRGDLDEICRVALRKEPEHRYISAAALAEDIQRFLDHQPVRAHIPSRGYRARKFVRRNRASVAFGGIAALALIGGSVTVGVLGRRAALERDLRQAQAERAAMARDFMVGTLSGFGPQPGSDPISLSSRDLVQRGRENLDGLAAGPPLRAALMNTLGQVAFNLGEVATADTLFRRAYDILIVEGGPDLAASMIGIGLVLQSEGDHEEAAERFRAALPILLDEGSDGAGTAELLYRLGNAELVLGRVTEAEAALRRARSSYLERAASSADSASIGDGVARADLALSRILQDAGRTTEARSLLEEAVTLAVTPALADEAASRLAATGR